jgi:hypothetical protein
MNTNWAKVLLFSLLSFALGFLICCMCCGRCSGGGCQHGGCDVGMHCARGASSCGHGHGGKACCKGGMHHNDAAEHGVLDGNAEVNRIAKDLERSGFIGDTTISIDGGTVRVMRNPDNTKVQVEMRVEDK